jgi:hypothetical protein
VKVRMTSLVVFDWTKTKKKVLRLGLLGGRVALLCGCGGGAWALWVWCAQREQPRRPRFFERFDLLRIFHFSFTHNLRKTSESASDLAGMV